MVVVFSLFALVQILLRVFIERPLATRRAEVVRHAFIFGCASRRFGRHVHAAYGVYESLCHFESPFECISWIRICRAGFQPAICQSRRRQAKSLTYE